MKKSLILFTILSISTLAAVDEYNFYLKGGIVYGNGKAFNKSFVTLANKMVDEKGLEILKTNNTLSSLMTNATDGEKNKKGLVDIMKMSNETFFTNKTKKLNYNLSFETTKNINENLELGLGISYIYNKNRNMLIKKDNIVKEIHKIIDNVKVKYNTTQLNGLTGLFDNSQGKFDPNLKLTFTEAKYNSLPIYATVKYNFDKNKEFNFKPYVKLDVGYSFNFATKPKLKVEGDLYKEFQKDDGSKINAYSDLNKKIVEETQKALANLKTTANGGLYTGVFVGAEYNNFLTELGMTYIGGKINYELDGKKGSTPTSSWQAIFNVGYKF